MERYYIDIHTMQQSSAGKPQSSIHIEVFHHVMHNVNKLQKRIPCLREQCIASFTLREGVLIRLFCYEGWATGTVQTIDHSNAAYIGDSFLFKVKLL